MAILHIRITEANQVIKLDRGIHSQNMTLKKVVIIKNKDQTLQLDQQFYIIIKEV